MVLYASATHGTVHWKSYTVLISGGISYKSTFKSGNALNIVLGAKTATRSATIELTEIKLTTASAQGSIQVTATLNGVVFSPSSATVGTVVQTPPNAPTMTLSATSQPQLSAGESNAAAGTLALTMSGDLAGGNGWVAGSVLTLIVSPPSGTNCEGGAYVYFASTPTATVTSTSKTSGSPSISASLANSGSCPVSQPNDLKLTFTNAVYFDTSSQGTVRVTISGVRYSVGTTSAAIGSGAVTLAASFSEIPSTVNTSSASNATIASTGTGPGGGTSGSGTASAALTVKADTPPESVLQDAYDAQISPVHVLESSATHVPAGYVCLSLTGADFNTNAAPSVTVSSGNGAASSTTTYQGEAATAAPTVEFQVSKASTTQGEYTVSGLAVDAATAVGPVTVTVTHGSSASCTHDSESIGSATAFSVAATPVTRVYGATPDATAVAELEHQFDAQGTNCPGRAGARPVVLATDAHYPDALASAYLASSLGTGELLTPTESLSAATANALRVEGITQVYIVGGPLAVSSAVSQQIESTLAYNCGGTTPLTSAGPVHIEVTRVAGATQYDTAEWVAEYPAPGTVGSLDVAGAYVGTNRTGGVGKYNDTAGNGSAAPGTSSTLPTAIVATGTSFQDAESASVFSYSDHLPILLTTPTSLSPQVASVISSLAIKQAIVMGGPLAVSDGVVSSLESLGVSVLRIAGQTATDTAVQLADFEMGSKSAHVGAGWTGNGGVAVARGDYFTDGLAGAVVASGAGRTHTHGPEPLLLCLDPSTAGTYLSAFLVEAGRTGIDGETSDRVTSLTVLGGPDALSPSLVATLTGDL